MKVFRFVQLKYQIFFSCVLVAVLPLLLTSFFLVRIFDLSLKRQALAAGNVQSREAVELFDGLLSDCVLACQSLDQSAATILIDSKNDDTIQELYMSLYTAASSLRTDAVFSIYDVGGMLRFTTDSQVAAPALSRFDGLLKSLIGTERKVYYYTPPYSGDGENESRFQAAYPIENAGGMRTGILVLDFSEESLENLFRGFYGTGSALILRDAQGNPVYSSNEICPTRSRRSCFWQRKRRADGESLPETQSMPICRPMGRKAIPLCAGSPLPSACPPRAR